MKLFRVLSMVTAALLATAGAGHAQNPATLLPVNPFPFPLERVTECPAPAWHIKAWNDGVIVWQQVRAMCAKAQQSGCCEGPTATAKAAGCAVGGLGCEAVQSKACACAKACACCEMCKSKKETAQMPLTPEMMRRLAALHGITQQPVPLAMPVQATQPPSCLPPLAPTHGIVQIMPVPVHVVQVVRHVNPVHFVTPELEAHCERMHHRGDLVILDGSVMLVCKKHAQPIRVEAMRVVVNMRDGSYTVESGSQPMTITTFGIQRTGAMTPPTMPATSPTTRSSEPLPAPTPSCPVERMHPFTFWAPLFR